MPPAPAAPPAPYPGCARARTRASPPAAARSRRGLRKRIATDAARTNRERHEDREADHRRHKRLRERHGEIDEENAHDHDRRAQQLARDAPLFEIEPPERDDHDRAGALET